MKVVKHQAKDGSLHDTAKLCEAHDRKLKLAPAMEKFVNSLAANAPGLGKDDRDHPCIYLEDLPKFLAEHADQLQGAISNALIVRKPRKKKEVGTVGGQDAKTGPAAANDALKEAA